MRIVIGQGSCGIAAGAEKVRNALIATDINKVTIYGDQDILDELDYVPVEVDVTGLNEDKSYDVIIRIL